MTSSCLMRRAKGTIDLPDFSVSECPCNSHNGRLRDSIYTGKPTACQKHLLLSTEAHDINRCRSQPPRGSAMQPSASAMHRVLPGVWPQDPRARPRDNERGEAPLKGSSPQEDPMHRTLTCRAPRQQRTALTCKCDDIKIKAGPVARPCPK